MALRVFLSIDDCVMFDNFQNFLKGVKYLWIGFKKNRTFVVFFFIKHLSNLKWLKQKTVQVFVRKKKVVNVLDVVIYSV